MCGNQTRVHLKGSRRMDTKYLHEKFLKWVVLRMPWTGVHEEWLPFALACVHRHEGVVRLLISIMLVARYVMKRLSGYWYLIGFLLIFVLHVLIGVKFRVFWLRLGRTCFNREAVYWLGCDPHSYRPPIRALGSNILADAAYRGYYDVVRQLISHVVPPDIEPAGAVCGFYS